MFVSWLSARRWLAADSIAGGEERNERQRQTEQENGEKYFFLLINRQDLLLLNGVWQDRKWRRTTLNVQSQMEKKQYVIMFLQMLVLTLVLYDWTLFCLHDDTPSSLQNNLQLLYEEFHTVSK